MYKKSKNMVFIYINVVVITLFMFNIITNVIQIVMRYKEFYNQETDNCIYMEVNEKALKYDQDEGEYEIENSNINNVNCLNESYKKDYIYLLNKLHNVDNICVKLSYLDIDLENPMSNNIGIYYTEGYPIKYNIIQGRFFTREDITSDKKMLVVGKNILKKAIKEDGQYYMTRNGEETIPIVGVIGNKDGESIYDNYVFYNLNAFIEDIREIGVGEWKVDSNKYTSSELQNLIDNNKRDNCIYGIESNIKDMKKTSYALSNTIDENKDMFISFAIVLLTIIIALIQSITYWLNKTKVEFGVRMQAGASKLNLIALVIKRFYFIEIISFMTASIIFCLYDKLFKENMLQYINLKSIINIIAFLVLFVIIAIIKSMVILNRNSIAKLVKEGNR